MTAKRRAPKPEPAVSLHPPALRIGDRFRDEQGEEWEVVGVPFATRQGKDVHVRLRRIDNPLLERMVTWSAHERVKVKRRA